MGQGGALELFLKLVVVVRDRMGSWTGQKNGGGLSGTPRL